MFLQDRRFATDSGDFIKDSKITFTVIQKNYYWLLSMNCNCILISSETDLSKSEEIILSLFL